MTAAKERNKREVAVNNSRPKKETKEKEEKEERKKKKNRRKINEKELSVSVGRK